MDTDTIAAISTPIGEGAIAIVRLSGSKAVEIADQLFKSRSGGALAEAASHTMHYGSIVEPGSHKRIEEAMVSVMFSPKTFTREDVVEINCHGGLVSVQRVLGFVLDQGARLAEPGEFTKRAFLNGRIDLSQAEAVMDLIRSKTDRAMDMAMSQMEGRLSALIQSLRQMLLEAVAHVEVNIDYPEYDADEVTAQWLLEKANNVRDEINRLIETARQGKILREGLSTVIIGRPNVGKSSLLNSLVHEDKAIVTDVPGTTRDVIEEHVNIRGVPLRLIDTAGIRETEDLVERMGVERSREVLKKADLILLLLNYNEVLTKEDKRLLEAVNGMNVVVVVNKTDLQRRLSVEQLKNLSQDYPLIETSILNFKGLEELENAIANLFFSGNVESQDMTYISNARHVALLNQAKKAVEDAMAAVRDGMPIDMAQIDMTRTWEILGEIVGDTASDDLIDQLFSQFCLGK